MFLSCIEKITNVTAGRIIKPGGPRVRQLLKHGRNGILDTVVQYVCIIALHTSVV